MAALIPSGAMTTGQAMATLVPYVEPAFKTARRGYKRAKQAYDWYESDPLAQDAASKIQKAFRGRKSKYSKRSAPSSRVQSQVNGDTIQVPGSASTTLSIGELYSRKIQFPPQGTGGNFHQRMNRSILVKGISLCERWTNNTAYPTRLHVAVIQAKRPIDDTAITSNFFRDNTDTTASALDFSAVGSSSTYDFRKDCYGINPDKFYILFHYKRVLDARTADSDHRANQREWFWTLEKYLKLNKQFVFENPTDDHPIQPLYLAWWTMPVSPDDWPADPSLEVNPMNYLYNEQTYFKG